MEAANTLITRALVETTGCGPVATPQRVYGDVRAALVQSSAKTAICDALIVAGVSPFYSWFHRRVDGVQGSLARGNDQQPG